MTPVFCFFLTSGNLDHWPFHLKTGTLLTRALGNVYAILTFLCSSICILPIFLYGAETWSVTATLFKKIDALDNWRLRCILNVHWTELITNDEVRSRIRQPFLSDTVRRCRLSFYGHLNCADPWQDHYRTLQTCIMGPPVERRWRTGRPRDRPG